MQNHFERNRPMPGPFGPAGAHMPTAGEPLPTVSRGPFTPPRLYAVEAGMPRLTSANLRMPAELVRRRAAELAAFARSGGARHSLGLWRSAYEQALLSLAREATRTPESAPCEALFWEQRDGEFRVAVTFGEARQRMLH